MGYQQQKHTVRYAERLPPEFAVFDVILFHKRIGIVENMARNLERDPVLSQVRSRLGGVPLESSQAMPCL